LPGTELAHRPADGTENTETLDLPPGPPRWSAMIAPPPEPEPDERPRPIPSPAPPVDEARPSPCRRYRWDGAETGTEQRSVPRSRGGTGCREDDVLHRFSPLRAGAMQRFLELSQPFRDAHFQPPPPTFGDRVLWLLRWFLWVAACGLLTAPHRLTADPLPAAPVDNGAAAPPARSRPALPVIEGGLL